MLKITRKQKKAALLAKAQRRFEPVLQTIVGEVVFMVSENDPNLVQNAVTTATLPLDGFVELFWDLLAKDDYCVENFKQMNLQNEYGISEQFFEQLKAVGCLTA